MKSSVFAENLMPERKRISLVVGNKTREIGVKPHILGIRWYLFMPGLLVTCVLIMPQVRGFFLDSGWRWIHVLGLSFGLSFSLNPLFSRVAWNLGMLDQPNARKVHQEATPLLGGASVFMGFLVALLMNGIFSMELGAILVASMILFGVGVADDYQEMGAGIKLLTQLVCSLVVMSCGILLKWIPADLGIIAHFGNAILTIFWIIGITNAMNFFDGMDGLAAGVGALIAFFLGMVAFQNNQAFVGWIAVAMMGSCLGFLPFNFKVKGNAAIFLGDAGSTVIGFILACLAVYGDWAEGDPVVALISPLLIFWVLVYDMVHITVERILSGKVLNFRQWIDYVGKDHLHHRLAHVLGGKKRSVIFIYVLSLCLGISAVALRNARAVDAVLLILQAAIMVVLITILERRGRMSNGTNTVDSGPLKTNLDENP